ncbi:MAG: diguanylate cyclase [Desulforhopalus sp.]|jgi:diguanylate cyclase (GGDEF)-like protein/PAS domain S-box-containing protein|nr:diguanylate cyclase [Desulforhopalus sp.]
MELQHLDFTGILTELYDGVYFVDRERKIVYWNKGAERISGFSAAEVIGRGCFDNILTHVDAEGKSLCRGFCPLAKTIADGRHREAEVFMHHKEGHRIPVLVRASPLHDRDGQVVGGVELFSDLRNILANNYRVKELERLALLDNLTQLGNRTYLERVIRVRFEEMKRLDGRFGLLFMDIDHFKNFNDTYGHDVGDRVLQFVANCFIANSRPFDFFGRWGGEEFIGLIRNVTQDELIEVGNRIRMLIEQSYIIHNQRKLAVTISLGATMAQAGDTPELLIKRADNLLYRSKELGRNCLTFG